jgi:hypothetical protein
LTCFWRKNSTFEPEMASFAHDLKRLWQIEPQPITEPASDVQLTILGVANIKNRGRAQNSERGLIAIAVEAAYCALGAIGAGTAFCL